MQEIMTTMAALAIEPGEFFPGPVAPMAALLARRKLAMNRFDVLLRAAIDAWVLNFFSIGEHSVTLEPDINPDLFSRRMKGQLRVKLVLDAQYCIPLVAIPFDRTGFDLALDRAVHHHFDLADLREGEATRLLLVLLQIGRLANDVIASLRIRERVKTAIGFIPGISWGLPFMHTAKEVLHRFVEASEHVLQHLGMDALILRAFLFDLWKLIGLHLVRDGDTAHLVGSSAFFQPGIVEFFGSTQDPCERVALFLCGI